MMEIPSGGPVHFQQSGLRHQIEPGPEVLQVRRCNEFTHEEHHEPTATLSLSLSSGVEARTNNR